MKVYGRLSATRTIHMPWSPVAAAPGSRCALTHVRAHSFPSGVTEGALELKIVSEDEVTTFLDAKSGRAVSRPASGFLRERSPLKHADGRPAAGRRDAAGRVGRRLRTCSSGPASSMLWPVVSIVTRPASGTVPGENRASFDVQVPTAGRLRLFLSRSAPVGMPAAVPSPPPEKTGGDDNRRRRDIDPGGRRDRLCIDGAAPQEQGAQREPDDPSHDGKPNQRGTNIQAPREET